MRQFMVPAVMAVLGLAGLLFVNRRAFYRRNVAGLEEFDGYSRMLLTRFVERVIRIVSWLCLLGGISAVLILGSR
jgi:hypothetical protein